MIAAMLYRSNAGSAEVELGAAPCHTYTWRSERDAFCMMELAPFRPGLVDDSAAGKRQGGDVRVRVGVKCRPSSVDDDEVDGSS